MRLYASVERLQANSWYYTKNVSTITIHLCCIGYAGVYYESMERDILKREIKKRGGATAVAKALGVTPCAVFFWQSGKRKPSDNLLNYLGLKKIEKLVRA